MDGHAERHLERQVGTDSYNEVLYKLFMQLAAVEGKLQSGHLSRNVDRAWIAEAFAFCHDCLAMRRHGRVAGDVGVTTGTVPKDAGARYTGSVVKDLGLPLAHPVS